MTPLLIFLQELIVENNQTLVSFCKVRNILLQSRDLLTHLFQCEALVGGFIRDILYSELAVIKSCFQNTFLSSDFCEGIFGTS